MREMVDFSRGRDHMMSLSMVSRQKSAKWDSLRSEFDTLAIGDIIHNWDVLHFGVVV